MKHISVCICTFKRPYLLKRLLEKLNCQITENLFTYSVVIADNDAAESAKRVVSEFAACSLNEVKYCIEHRKNIALARNKALEHAQGDFIAFIDDDEYPTMNWLLSLFKACNVSGIDGVLGPVKPYFEQKPPKWVTRGGFFERPTHATGYKISLSEARTGNVMFRRNILDGVQEPFRAEFGTGGEDVDFFRRMIDKGNVFIWCNEAIVYEAVSMKRCKRSYLLKRALLRGRNSLKNPAGRLRNIVKSLVAIPVYSLALPVLLVLSDYQVMKCLIKFCDHSGRILTLIGLNPVRERDLS